MIGYGTRSFGDEHQHRRACREQHEQVEQLVVAQIDQVRPLSCSSCSAYSLFSSSSPHPTQDLGGLRELDLRVGDDLHLVSPRVEERVAAEDLHARLARRREHRRLIVDDEPEVAGRIRALGPSFGEREELVAHVDEGHPVHPAAQLQVEQSPVEVERLVDRAHFEREVVDSECPRHGR